MGPAGVTGLSGPQGPAGFPGFPGEAGPAGDDGESAVLDVVTLDQLWRAEIDLDQQAQIVVMGTVRASSSAPIGIEIAGRRIATTNGSALFPETVAASATVPKGRHVVRLIVPAGVEVKGALTVIAFAQEGEGRRRAAGR